jgi:hypothetical protein
MADLKDLREEQEDSRSTLLETIREQEKDIEFLNIVVKAMVREYELENLRERSRWDENNQRWVVPVFYVKERAVVLPKVGIRNAEALVESELEKRDFIIQD